MVFCVFHLKVCDEWSEKFRRHNQFWKIAWFFGRGLPLIIERSPTNIFFHCFFLTNAILYTYAVNTNGNKITVVTTEKWYLNIWPWLILKLSKLSFINVHNVIGWSKTAAIFQVQSKLLRLLCSFVRMYEFPYARHDSWFLSSKHYGLAWKIRKENNIISSLALLIAIYVSIEFYSCESSSLPRFQDLLYIFKSLEVLQVKLFQAQRWKDSQFSLQV